MWGRSRVAMKVKALVVLLDHYSEVEWARKWGVASESRKDEEWEQHWGRSLVSGRVQGKETVWAIAKDVLLVSEKAVESGTL